MTRVEMAALRRSPQRRLRAAIGVPFGSLVAIMLCLVATKSIYLGADSINNYAHVWYISESLQRHSLPAHFKYLENGRALTFPYGFVPWTIAALCRPLVGDYAVTWTMVGGILLLVGTVYTTRLQRERWLLAWFVICPPFVASILSFQLAFVWALLFGFLYVHALERGRSWRALFWFVVSAGNHLVIMGPILLAYNLVMARRRPELRRTLLRISILGIALLGPEIWYVAQTPEVENASRAVLIGITALTLAERGLLFAWPFLIRALEARGSRILNPAPAVLWAGLVGFYCAMLNGVGDPGTGYHGLRARASNDYESYLHSPQFVPGAVYRVMEATNEEQGQYFFIEHAAILSNEFFSESMSRRRWTEDDYTQYLARKHIDFVVLNRSYARGFKKSYAAETDVLANLVSEGRGRLTFQDPQQRFVVFDVRATSDRYGAAAPRAGNKGEWRSAAAARSQFVEMAAADGGAGGDLVERSHPADRAAGAGARPGRRAARRLDVR